MAQIRIHGIARTHVWEMRGGNYRLDALQAAILGVKLDHWPARLARRKAIGQRLVAAAERGGDLPVAGTAACSPVFAPLALRIAGGRRNDRLAYLREKGIDARVHYPMTLAACPPFSGYPGSGHYPEAERATRELLSIPCHPEMTDEEVTYVEAALSNRLR
jgi:UDP-2-acetamido-2-deoxy-ribo-hexuluronate aminotransferase